MRRQARPWIDSGCERASDDPYTIAQVGELVIRQNAAEALLVRAGALVDAATRAPDEDSVARASIAVAEAKALGTKAGLNAANRLHELGGTRSTLCRARSGPTLAEPAHPYVARSRSLEICGDRQLSPERD